MPFNYEKVQEMTLSQRRQSVAAFYAERYTQTEIAEELGISQTTVSRDVKALIKLWKEASVADIDQRIADELGRINNLEREYWKAWKASWGTHEVKRTKLSAKTTKDGEISNKQPLEQSIEKRELLGNPAYLHGVQWCIDRRIALLGLDESSNKTHLTMKAYLVVSPDDWDDEVVEGEIVKDNNNGHHPELTDGE